MADLARDRPSRAAERARSEDAGKSEYLAFRVGHSVFAVPVAIVREIVRTSHITSVPRAPHAVLGITSFRGRIVTVLDLGLRLGEGSSANTPERGAKLGDSARGRMRTLMVDVAGETIGLTVDEVLVVHRFSSREIERASQAVGADVAEHVVGIARPTEGEVVQLLDAKALTP
ncbi:MAG TPA: chemotaxis protein CheW [Polyangiaceae bacterium]|nr:chemotaxis protein CheW [Polyangiaceae bacterium]